MYTVAYSASEADDTTVGISVLAHNIGPLTNRGWVIDTSAVIKTSSSGTGAQLGVVGRVPK